MRRRVRVTSRWAGAAAAVSAWGVAGAAALAQQSPPPTPAPVSPTPTINVLVDGQPVVFQGQGAVTRAGSVLVPLRGVFEKLGAGVQYVGQTKTIIAIKGSITVSLRIGDPTAYVNDQPRPLAVPPQLINNATLVPLRFVSEALGELVKWDEGTQTVQILTPKPPDNGPVVGVVTALDTAASTVSVRPSGADHDTVVTITPEARVLTKAGADAAIVATLAALRLGDQVTIRRDNDGRGTDLEADYEEKKGEIKAFTAEGGTPKVTFADDSVVELMPGAVITRGTEPRALTDLQPRQTVTLRVNGQTHQAVAGDIAIPKVTITSVGQSAGTRLLKANDEVTVTVLGTPGATGKFSVNGLSGISDLPLAEVKETPGTYSGSFKVPSGATLQDGIVSASLTILDVTAPPAQSSASLQVDATAPTFADLVPSPDANLTDARPSINGTYADQGSGIVKESTQVFVNGKDVTEKAQIQKGFFNYKPAEDLPPGTNKIVVVARDAAGNESRQEWSFNVMPIVSPLRVVTTDAPENRPLLAGETLKIRAEATPGGTARYSVGSNGVITGGMVEESPGVYIGTYTVRKGDAMTKAPVTVSFTPSGSSDKPAILAAIRTISLSAGTPHAPIIDLPVEGTAVGGYVTISGRGTPNTRVRLKLTYNGKVFLLNTSKGGERANLDLTVGADGMWTTELLTLSTGREVSNPTFTIEAVTVTPDGDTSDTAVVHFKK